MCACMSESYSGILVQTIVFTLLPGAAVLRLVYRYWHWLVVWFWWRHCFLNSNRLGAMWCHFTCIITHHSICTIVYYTKYIHVCMHKVCVGKILMFVLSWKLSHMMIWERIGIWYQLDSFFECDESFPVKTWERKVILSKKEGNL